MTKIKKILTLGFLSLTLCGLFATLQVAQAADIADMASDAWDSATSGDLCNDINDAVSILDCGSEDIVSFIGFEGGLTPPTGEGLDTTLTRAKSAREFIVNTVNFALSFLGLIAVVIVIYGGFLYVTAAGDETQSGKGKKAITYAVIGILIIIASFALVNTLLTFGGGSGTDRGDGGQTIRGAGQEGTNIGVQSIYNYGATEINTSLNNFVSAYKILVTVNGVITKIKAIPQPNAREKNRTYLSELTSAITQIKNNSSSLSKTQMAARGFLDGWLTKTSVKDLTSADFEDGKLKGKFLTAMDESGIADASKEDFLATINDLIGENKQGGKIGSVRKILGDVAEAQTSNYVGRNFNSDKNLQRAFAGVDPTVPVKQIFDDAVNALDNARGLKNSPNEVQLVVKVAQSLNRLFVIVKNVEFVLVKVRASVKEGSAPLVVELNGLDSRDPTGDTIAETRYVWEPDGTYSEERENGPNRNVDCPTRTGPTIVCTYSQPGTYVVRLKVTSSDPARVATGQAFLPITVQPSVARITLDATAGGITEKLRTYKQDGTKWVLENDLNEFHITTAEAKNPGVKFNAASSKDGHGLDVKAYEWNFGDGTGVETTSSVTHKYKNEGKFPLRLEVTDNGNRKDRKLVNVVVGSVAARMQVNKSIAEPDELIELDGSISRSDSGPIAAYSWKIKKGEDDVTNLQNVVAIIGDNRSPVFRAKFKTPGMYSVTLEVSDGSTNATRSENISIKSRKPRANFSVRACPENCPFPSEPGIVEVDASASFDPDKDTLLYKWIVLDDKGNEKQEDTIFSEASSPKKPLFGPDAKKINLKFTKIGKYKIQLTLQDDLPEELQQTD
ncbi:MAG: PKD domain-containing protein, partial [Patescibacteria group bacterium]